MRRELATQQARWIDILATSEEEVRSVSAALALPQELVDELATPSVQAKFAAFPEHNLVYLIFSVPTVKRPGTGTEAEVDLVIAPDALLTVHYEHIDPLHKLFKELEVALLKQPAAGLDGFDFARLAVKKLYSSIAHDLAAIRADLETIEEGMYRGEEKQMVFAIAQSARDLLNVRQAVEQHRIVWRQWDESIDSVFVGEPSLREKARRTLQHIRHIFEEAMLEIRMLTDWLRELRETNNSLVSTKQNEVMKILTILAFVTFPLTLISSIFGMNTAYLPLVGTPGDFWIIMGMMAALTVGFFTFFWWKGWLR